MDKNLTIKERILKFAEETGIKKKDLFNAIGVEASNFKGKNKESQPGGEMIVKILSTYQDISPDWLLLGVGSMLRNSPIIKEEQEISNPHILEKLISQAKEIGALESRIEQLEVELTTAKQQLSEARIKNAAIITTPPKAAPVVP